MNVLADSSAYRGIDPMELKAKQQRTEQRRIARRIARLPDEQWPEKVRLELTDWQEEIWAFLRAILTARQLGLSRQ